MLSRYLTVLEHQSLPVGQNAPNALTALEADRLAAIGETRKGFIERGYHFIRFAQYCGLVNLGERTLEILPKIDTIATVDDCRGVLLRLLRASGAFPVFKHFDVGHSLRHGALLEVFISAFFDAIADVARGGLLRQYRLREADLQVVRGRIVARRQFAVHANRPDVVTCEFDDLTADNLWNRILRAALLAIRPWIRSAELNRRWIEMMIIFDEVADVRPTADQLRSLQFDRHAIRYRVAIEWARWIINLLSPALRVGANEAPGLLVDMNMLFESAIAAAWRRQLPERRFALSTQEHEHYLALNQPADRREFALRPDMVIRQNGRVIAIADTKWKRVDVNKAGFLMPRESDAYQLLAYAAAYQCDRLALVYPWYDGLNGSRETSLTLTMLGGHTPILDIVCVDVRSDFFEILRGRRSRLGELMSDRLAS